MTLTHAELNSCRFGRLPDCGQRQPGFPDEPQQRLPQVLAGALPDGSAAPGVLFDITQVNKIYDVVNGNNTGSGARCLPTLGWLKQLIDRRSRTA